MNGQNVIHDPVMKDRVVVVTGSSMGIGKTTALELGRRGAKVVLNSRRADRLQATADELTERGIQTLAIPADVASPEDAARLVDRTVETFGRLNILVNNAGISMRGLFESRHPGLPWISVYGASKMALTGLAESLRLELDGSGCTSASCM